MADGVRISARSNNGCWTCRLRRKKCDEIRPVCSVCVSLDLECHGYGPKPAWMDNGVLQREQAAKFKRLVSQTKYKKGKRQQPSTSLPPGRAPSISMCTLPTDVVTSPGPTSLYPTPRNGLGAFPQDEYPFSDGGMDLSCFLSNDNLPPLAAPSPVPIDPHLGAFAQHGLLLQEGGVRYSGPNNHPPWSGWPTDPTPMMESPIDLEGYDVVTPRTPTNPLVHNLLTPPASEATLFPAATLSLLREATEMGNNILPRRNSQFTRHETASMATRSLPSSASEHNSLTARDITNHDYTRSLSPESSSSESSPSGSTEDSLFMHYLDRVFYEQYPFYHTHRGTGRGWLFAILRRVKSAYHATLALSERHLLSARSPSGDLSSQVFQLRTQNGHYDLAIQELQKMESDISGLNGQAHVKSILELLMSLLQLFYFELFNGGRQKWQTHLRTACDAIPKLLRARMAPPMQDIPSPDWSNPSAPALKTTLCTEVERAFNFLLGSVITLDILASASTRSAPIMDINHMQVLQEFGISVQSIIGCQNSVLALILDISLLDRWKKNAEHANKLSVVELAKRGDRLQERLRQELAVIERKPPTVPNQLEIGRIFTLSAMTYLHVVISGAYPQVPEIAASVAETISAFRSLNDPKLLRSLVWPFCISGCLALEKHYDFFRGLASRAGIMQWSTGTCFEALQIMEDCWKARVTSSEHFDWATTMKRRGCYVFLG